jgi:uncharacterized membrane protein YbhN (UPF0104 family)
MERLLHRVISVLGWAAALLLGAFGLYFTFTNYPAFGIAVTLAIVVLLSYAERRRRQRQRAADRARRRSHMRSGTHVSPTAGSRRR